eukprot:1942645-Pyramimonas_sp.AAC.1
MHRNPARSSGKVVSSKEQARSNEGGELFSGQSPPSSTHSAGGEGSGSQFQGRYPVGSEWVPTRDVAFSGCSIVLIVLYSHPSIAMISKNRTRCQRIGALAKSAKMPWVMI